jgi:hypothetical protein
MMALLSLALLLNACAGTPELSEKPSEEFPGLYAVSNSGFNEAWARPDSELASYDIIEVSGLRSAGAEVVQPGGSSRLSGDWELTPERQQALAAAWREAMTSAAQRGGLDSSGRGEKVLRVDARLTRIAPRADFSQSQQSAGRTTVFTEDSGEASIEIRLRDRGSDELLVVIRDRRRVGPRMWSQANTITATADLRSLFNSWSNQLVTRIRGNGER